MARSVREPAVPGPGAESPVPAELVRDHYAELVRLAYCLTGDRRRATVAVDAAYNRSPMAATTTDPLRHLRAAVVRGCRTLAPATQTWSWRATPLELVDRPSSDVSILGSRAERREQLVAELQALPWRLREVLVCRHYLDLSEDATGRLLRVGRATVRRRDRRGIGALAAGDPRGSEVVHQRRLAAGLGHGEDLPVPTGEVEAAVARLGSGQPGRGRPRGPLRHLAPAAAALVAMLALVGASVGWPSPAAAPAAHRSSGAVAGTPLPIPGDSFAPFTRVGIIGLPPPGSPPTWPRDGRLVDSYPVRGGGAPFSGQVRLYDDGRLVWYMFHGDDRGRTLSTGYLEQRLTAEGVRLVSSSSDLTAKDPLRLRGWLPASAWASQPIRAYVPSRFGVCVDVYGAPGHPGQRAEPQERLDLLPAKAARMLRGASGGLGAVRDTGFPVRCWGMTTPEARRLDRVLRAAGLERPETANRFALEYERRLALAPGLRVAVRFEPELPDGRIGCSTCG